MTSPDRDTFGQLQAVHLKSPDGAEAIITLYGAHVVSWKGARGKEHLFVSRRSALDGSRAIRGGVPVIFPQFAERGSGMRHGFARALPWRVERSGVDSGGAYAVLVLGEADLPAAMSAAWPHRFALALRVAVHANELSMVLEVRNTGVAAFPFAAALHTYHLVDNVAAVRIEGLEAEPVVIKDKLDRVYEGISGLIAMQSGTSSALHHEQSGFTDAVVWNPGAADAAALADMEDDEYRRFVCIEPALLGPAMLEAGGVWRGEYRLKAA